MQGNTRKYREPAIVFGLAGEYRTYEGPDNEFVEYRFGSTVYWDFLMFRQNSGKDVVGIAGGSFEGKDFPKPERECLTDERHDWLDAVSDAVWSPACLNRRLARAPGASYSRRCSGETSHAETGSWLSDNT